MFSVLFEAFPKSDQWDNLGNAKMLRPKLEKIDGFVDNTRYNLTPDRARKILVGISDQSALQGSAKN